MTNTDDDMVRKISRMLEIGGTMLAQHCDVCGAPMFRYQGKIMCPVCESVSDPRARLQQKLQPEIISGNKVAPVSVEAPSLSNEMEEIQANATMEDTVKTDATSKVSISGPGGYSSTQSSSPSADELESLLMEKMVSFARSMRTEDDIRKISDHMDMIERGLSIIEKMRKTL
ncbi:MAG: Sjogren's syndrome/scleroderma autoantigen 1 family protein [Methanolobus sp.]|nr:Sjogren's syndrome/scleroderma autoantigen 1 family protein [Methanolobus sp.]